MFQSISKVGQVILFEVFVMNKVYAIFLNFLLDICLGLISSCGEDS